MKQERYNDDLSMFFYYLIYLLLKLPQNMVKFHGSCKILKIQM